MSFNTRAEIEAILREAQKGLSDFDLTLMAAMRSESNEVSNEAAVLTIMKLIKRVSMLEKQVSSLQNLVGDAIEKDLL